MEAVSAAGWTESKAFVCPAAFVLESCPGDGELSCRSCCCGWSPYGGVAQDLCQTDGESGDAELVIRPRSIKDQRVQRSRMDLNAQMTVILG